MLSCDQYAILDDLFIKLKSDSSFTGDNLWLNVLASSFVAPIFDTGICQVMFKSNPDDEWIFGLNLLNQYTIDFDIDNMAFSMVNYNGVKDFESLEEGFEAVIVENGLPWDAIALQTLLTSVLVW